MWIMTEPSSHEPSQSLYVTATYSSAPASRIGRGAGADLAGQQEAVGSAR